MDYLFTSDRLGFRQWEDRDIEPLHQINTDPRVMEYFPAIQTREQTSEFVLRMQAEYSNEGYCYFAVDALATMELIGFIGLSQKTFVSDFTPCTDLGWRLTHEYWNQGFATEGARRCLQFAFQDLQLQSVKAIAPAANARSVRVMQKIGMRLIKTFQHPSLDVDSWLQPCVLYEATKR